MPDDLPTKGRLAGTGWLVTPISGVGGFSILVFLNLWASILKFWMVLGFGNYFLFKSILAGCVMLYACGLLTSFESLLMHLSALIILSKHRGMKLMLVKVKCVWLCKKIKFLNVLRLLFFLYLYLNMMQSDIFSDYSLECIAEANDLRSLLWNIPA